MLRPGEAGLRLNVGLSGTGKTRRVKTSVDATVRLGHPVIVVDRCYEWSDVPRDLAAVTVGATSVALAAKHLAAGKRLAIVRPKDDGAADTLAACAWVCQGRELRGVAIPEADTIAPNGARLPRELNDVCARWRHFNVAAWFDTQRFAKLSTDVTQQAFGGEVCIFAIAGPRDLATVRDLGGADLERAVVACADRFMLARAHCSRGCPSCAHNRGWYVVAGEKPYAPRRDP